MPIDPNDPEVRKLVDKSVADALAQRDKEAKLKKEPTNYTELEDRLTERISDRVIEKLAGIDEGAGGGDGGSGGGGLGKIGELFFGKPKASAAS